VAIAVAAATADRTLTGGLAPRPIHGNGFIRESGRRRWISPRRGRR
jgi:hypothetical protein